MTQLYNMSRAARSQAGKKSADVRHKAAARVARTVKPGVRARSIRGGEIYTVAIVAKSGTGSDYRIRMNTGTEYTSTQFFEVFEVLE